MRTALARPPRIGVLALQGAFREHAAMLQSLGASVTEVRKPEDLPGLAGVVLPGGESTTIGKLLVEWELMEALRALHRQGVAFFGTCAGLILLCRDIEGSDQPRLGFLEATVRRNAFGRQADSFEGLLAVEGLPPQNAQENMEETAPFPAVFIRAPLILSVGDGVRVLARVRPAGETEERVVAVRQGNVLATSFHPELTQDSRMHSLFLDMTRPSPD